MPADLIIMHSPAPVLVTNLRPCLSPARILRPVSPMATDGIMCPSSPSSVSSEGWYKRKCVRFEGFESEDDDGCPITSTFHTYSASEYDRTSIAPPSEHERSCVLPARGSRCLSKLWDDHRDDDEADHADADDEAPSSDDDIVLPRSPFATPEDSDSDGEAGDDEWRECFERRRMMFARMCPLEGDAAHPQFEGYRSLSSTLMDLLRSVGCDEEGYATPRAAGGAATPTSNDDDDTVEEDDDTDDQQITPGSSFPVTGFPVNDVFAHLRERAEEGEDGGFPVTDVFARLREGSTDSDAIATPSLVSSADSDADFSGLTSPRGSAIDFLPSASSSPWKIAGKASDRERERDRFDQHSVLGLVPE